MFSSKKLFSLIGAAGLAFGASACSSSSSGGSITINCVDGSVTICADGTVTYSVVTPVGDIPETPSSPVDYNEVINDFVCAHILDLTADDDGECEDPGLEDEDGGLCEVTISDNPDFDDDTLTYYSVDGTINVVADGSNDDFQGFCDDIDNSADITADDPTLVETDCTDCTVPL